ncbi:MAG: HAD-IB family phosphatase [Verrucomicrobiota bacterium]
MNPVVSLEVSVDGQRLDVFEAERLLRSYPVSTAAKGVGFGEGTFRTPVGRFRVMEKLGEGASSGAVFQSRVAVGSWSPGSGGGEDLVLTRILRLDGMDPENANTLERCIYIHGTNREELIGSPASHGCIRLRNADMLELFELVPAGTPLVIHPPQRLRGKVIFLDCDSTLSGIEGIDELARVRGAEVYAEVVALTHAAMNGEVPLDEVFARRMAIIRPDQAACEEVAALYVATLTPGALELIHALKADAWLPVILSGGFAPLIAPLARYLGIEHVEAVPLLLDAQGRYAGYGQSYPTTRNLGKNQVINEWKQALLPQRVAMMGDGMSDLETQPDVDVFIGFGGVVARSRVKQAAQHWLDSMTDVASVLNILNGATHANSVK